MRQRACPPACTRQRQTNLATPGMLPLQYPPKPMSVMQQPQGVPWPHASHKRRLHKVRHPQDVAVLLPTQRVPGSGVAVNLVHTNALLNATPVPGSGVAVSLVHTNALLNATPVPGTTITRDNVRQSRRLLCNSPRAMTRWCLAPACHMGRDPSRVKKEAIR